MNRSSLSLLPFALVAVVATTGCAGKVRSNAGLSLHGNLGASAPSIKVSGQGNACGSAQGQGSASGSSSGYGGTHGSAYGQGNTSGSSYGYGGAQGSVNVGAYGHGSASGASYGYGGAQASGGVEHRAPAPIPFTPQPIFFGVPLGGAQDVVFVLDRSGSMTSSVGTSSSAPTSPLAALATFGLHAAATVKTASSLLPTQQGLWLNPLQTISSTPSKIDAAKSELIGALAGLPDGTRFNIVFFNEGTATLSPQMVTMNPLTRLNAVSFVHGIAADGLTAAVPALRTAYSSRPYRVVFLSDGVANVGGTGQDLLAEARVQMRRGVRFDTVGVGSDQDGPLMQALAAESGGISVKR